MWKEGLKLEVKGNLSWLSSGVVCRTCTRRDLSPCASLELSLTSFTSHRTTALNHFIHIQFFFLRECIVKVDIAATGMKNGNFCKY